LEHSLRRMKRFLRQAYESEIRPKSKQLTTRRLWQLTSLKLLMKILFKFRNNEKLNKLSYYCFFTKEKLSGYSQAKKSLKLPNQVHS